VEFLLKNGQKIVDELAVANAHPAGEKPFRRPEYVKKFLTLTEGIVAKAEAERFLAAVERLPKLSAAELVELNVQVELSKLERNVRDTRGIF
jgi:2-methylcitrate dehydratase